MVATSFAEGDRCESVLIVDYAPPPDSGPGASTQQSFVQLCAARVTDGSSLEDFMRRTYGDAYATQFESTTLGGARAYRAGSSLSNATFFVQPNAFRVQIVTGVVADAERQAARLAEVDAIIRSISFSASRSS